MREKRVCLVTIHGIGFEQAPGDGIAGYADLLHEHLSAQLGASLLGDDPGRARSHPGQNGPVYVESFWPPQAPTREQGLARLGRWSGPDQDTLDPGKPLLVDSGQPIAHVALVYSHLEPTVAYLGSGFVAAEMATVSALHYASVRGLAHIFLADPVAMLTQHSNTAAAAPSSLQVRTDLPAGHPRLRALLHRPAVGGPQQPSGLPATVLSLMDDVAAYVSRNDLRERVRSFITEALLRIAARDDIDALVVNAHSNGTVIAFDVLRELRLTGPRNKLRWFVTAGSPLRKYSELFNWGTDAGYLHKARGWINFWDASDPVADPLSPPFTWRRDDAMPVADGSAGLYSVLQPDAVVPDSIPITDKKVDNLHNSGDSGLRAHNYWDNESEVVAPLARLLQSLVTGDGS